MSIEEVGWAEIVNLIQVLLTQGEWVNVEEERRVTVSESGIEREKEGSHP